MERDGWSHPHIAQTERYWIIKFNIKVTDTPQCVIIITQQQSSQPPLLISPFPQNNKLMKYRRSLFKILVIGESAVGKTSLLKLYCDDKLTQSHKATIGVDLLTKEVSFEGKVAALEIWDTAGQERFRSMTDAFYRDSKCCLLVFDLTNADSFKEIESWKNLFLDKGCPTNAQNFPLILVGNKADLKDLRKVAEREINQYLANNKTMRYFETSVHDAQSVETMMQSIVKVLVQTEKDNQQIMLYDTLRIDKKKAKKERRCC